MRSDRDDVLADGLDAAALAARPRDRRRSPVPDPVGGAGRDDVVPRFDQQPIEVAALADACARAYAVTGDDDWRRGVDLAIDWFAGDNDVGAVMWDPDTARWLSTA